LLPADTPANITSAGKLRCSPASACYRREVAGFTGKRKGRPAMSARGKAPRSTERRTRRGAAVTDPERRTRSLAELAAEQGVTGPQDVDALFGAGADLWRDDADFEAFLAGLRESRRTGG
jgi:hypothetical protein